MIGFSFTLNQGCFQQEWLVLKKVSMLITFFGPLLFLLRLLAVTLYQK